jgi:hypothetical protein
MHNLARTLLAAFLAYSSHYAFTKTYAWVCIPDGVSGFFTGMMHAGSPICAGILNVMSHSHVTFTTIVVTSMSRLLIDTLDDFTKPRKEEVAKIHKED